MIICEHCGASVSGKVCEYCGMPVNSPAPTKIIFPEKTPIIKQKKEFIRAIIAGAVLTFAISLGIMKSQIHENHSMGYIQSPATQHAIEHHAENVIEEKPVYNANEILSETGVFPSGKYQIGVDIPEGLYIFIPDLANNHGVEGVYSDPECNNQISSAYVHFDGTRIAELSGNGYVEFSWATAYNLDMHPEIVNNPYEHDGMFIVGRDIPAGTYTLESYGDFGEYAEWYIYSGINAVGTVLKEAGVIEQGDGYVDNVSNEITLRDGEILELKYCRITDN